MKTTINISGALLIEAKRRAVRDGSTVNALIERGLRTVLAESKPLAPFRLRKATFKGEGLQQGVKDASWERLRDFAYTDRGGRRLLP